MNMMDVVFRMVDGVTIKGQIDSNMNLDGEKFIPVHNVDDNKVKVVSIQKDKIIYYYFEKDMEE